MDTNTAELELLRDKKCISSIDTVTNTYSQTPQAKDFYEANVIPDLQTKTYRVLVTHNTSDEESYINYYEFLNGIGYVPDVFVATSHRQKNIGSNLLNHAVNHLSKVGVDEVYIYPTNPVMTNIVESHGFNETNIFEGFYTKEI